MRRYSLEGPRRWYHRGMEPTREQAVALFKEHNGSESLYKHALAVEAVMRRFAEKYGEDPEKWGIIGFIHDLDWEQWPEEHCVKTRELLVEAGWPEDWIRAVVSHGWGLVTDVEPVHVMEKVLYAVDELTGLVNATALMRPTKISDLTAKSVKKKWKDKGFAAGVNRADVEEGAEMLGVPLAEHMGVVLEAMQGIAGDLGLAGA